MPSSVTRTSGSQPWDAHRATPQPAAAESRVEASSEAAAAGAAASATSSSEPTQPQARISVHFIDPQYRIEESAADGAVATYIFNSQQRQALQQRVQQMVDGPVTDLHASLQQLARDQGKQLFDAVRQLGQQDPKIGFEHYAAWNPSKD